MNATDSRTLRERLTDALLIFIENQRPVRQVTARRHAHNAFLLGVDAQGGGNADGVHEVDYEPSSRRRRLAADALAAAARIEANR